MREYTEDEKALLTEFLQDFLADIRRATLRDVGRNSHAEPDSSDFFAQNLAVGLEAYLMWRWIVPRLSRPMKEWKE